MCMFLDWGGNWRAHAGIAHADAAAPAVLWLVQGCFYHPTAAFCYFLCCELNTLGGKRSPKVVKETQTQTQT